MNNQSIYDIPKIKEFFSDEELYLIQKIFSSLGIDAYIDRIMKQRSINIRRMYISISIILCLAWLFYFLNLIDYIVYLFFPAFFVLFWFSWYGEKLEKNYRNNILNHALKLLDNDFTLKLEQFNFAWKQEFLSQKWFLNSYNHIQHRFYSLNIFKKPQIVSRSNEKNSYIITHTQWILLWYKVVTETYSTWHSRYLNTNNCYIYEIPLNWIKNPDMIDESLLQLNVDTWNNYSTFQYENILYLKRDIKVSMFDEYESEMLKKLKTWPTFIPSLKEVLSLYYDMKHIMIFIDSLKIR